MKPIAIQQWGNSAGLRLGKDILTLAGLAVGTVVNISVRDRTIVIEPAESPAEKLSAMLADCDFSAPRTSEEQAWLDIQPIGKELL